MEDKNQNKKEYNRNYLQREDIKKRRLQLRREREAKEQYGEFWESKIILFKIKDELKRNTHAST